jgi:hypothetical protein
LLQNCLASGDELSFIYLDKNYPPADVKQILSQLPQERVKPVSIVPISSGYEQYPFSLSFIL